MSAAVIMACGDCGGALRRNGRPVAPAPSSADGCACSVRATVRVQRPTVARLATAGQLGAEVIAALVAGDTSAAATMTAPVAVLPPRRGCVGCGRDYDACVCGDRMTEGARLDRETE